MTKPTDKGSEGTFASADDQTQTEGSDDLKRRLDALDQSLEEKGYGAHQVTHDETPKTGDYGQAFKLSSEFIAGIVTGGLIGYLIDHFAGTTPWGLIIFLLLGFVAGILNVLRSAGYVAKPDERMK